MARADASRPVVAILAGGASRRMGRDKAALTIDGAPVLDMLAREAAAAGLSSVVIGREPMPGITGVSRWLVDDTPGEGPLAALATALRALDAEIILVACDMPRLDARALDWLACADLPGSTRGLVVRNGEILEPLFARYRPEALAAIDELLAAGRRSIGALIDTGNIATVDAPAWLTDRLVNVNTPEDLARLGSRPGTGDSIIGGRMQ